MSGHRIVLFVALVGLVACSSDDDTTGADDSTWPMWGYDLHNSRSNPNETAIGTDNVGSLTRAWAADGPGVTSTPLVHEGTVYFGTWLGDIAAYDLVSGDELWTTNLGEAPISASISIRDGVVFGSGGNEVFALNAENGSLVWRQAVDDHPMTQMFSTPVPIPDEDMLVVGVSSIELTQELDDYTFRGSLVALRISDGGELWRVYVSENDDTSGAGVSVWSSVAVDVDLGMVFVGTGNTYEEPASPLSDSLIAVDYSTGEMEWSRQFTEGDVYVVPGPADGPDADIGAAPNLFTIDGVPVVGVGDKAGTYAVFERATGDTVWTIDVGSGSPLGGIMVAAAYDDGGIYLTNNTWAGTNILPDFFEDANTSEAVALDASTGDVMWRTELSAPSFGAVSIANGVVYCTTTEGDVYGLDQQSGAVLWTARPGSEMGGGVAIADGQVVVGYGFSLFKAPSEIEGGLVAYRLP